MPFGEPDTQILTTKCARKEGSGQWNEECWCAGEAANQEYLLDASILVVESGQISQRSGGRIRQ